MSLYYFHLKFELYTTPADSSRKQAQFHSSSSFKPTPQTDIFRSVFPAHRTSKWENYSFAIRGPTNSTSTHISNVPYSSQQSPSDRIAEFHSDALLLPERRSKHQRDVSRSPRTTRAIKPSNEAASQDWRYDRVQIESIDMEVKNTKGKVKTPAGNGLHTKAIFVPSDPTTTDVGWGVVHLYRDTEESAIHGQKARVPKSLEGTGRMPEKDQDTSHPDDCTTLCILAVPSWMMPSDLLGFVGDQAREDVSHFRLIRTGRANKYMVLMKFRSSKKARDWQELWNGKLFSAAEPENCHVVFIKSVEFLSSDADISSSSFPQTANDPFLSTSTSNNTSNGLSSKPLAPPPPNLLELPTCPVCLERMDETTGLLTILCQHVFHCACLEKWRGSGCPVCRYTQSPSYTFPYPRPSYGDSQEDADAEAACSICTTTSNLWVCLICGNIGCGRYDSAHAYAHYEATSHCYAMDISTQHVWDYAGDGYVHRLIQSKPLIDPTGGSGGVGETNKGSVNLPMRIRHANEAFRVEGGDSVPREKMESMAAEYTYLLTSQLEGQRRYFEEQVERAVDKAMQASTRAEDAASSASRAQAKLADSLTTQQELSERLSQMERTQDKLEKMRKKFELMARDMSAQLREEKMLNDGLLARVQTAEREAGEAKKTAEALEAEKRELQDTNHDLSMFISSQEKVRELQAQGEEVVAGTVSIPQPSTAKKKGKVKTNKP